MKTESVLDEDDGVDFGRRPTEGLSPVALAPGLLDGWRPRAVQQPSTFSSDALLFGVADGSWFGKGVAVAFSPAALLAGVIDSW